MSLGAGSFNNLPVLAKRVTVVSKQIRRDDAEEFKRYIEEESPVDTGFLQMSYVTYETGKYSTVVASNAEYADPVNNGYHTVNGRWIPGQHFRERAMGRLRRSRRRRRLF